VASRLVVGACALAALVLPSAALAGSADVAALQVALRLRGAHHGAIDGILGPETRGAIRRFQRREGLVVDGVAGRATLRALGLFARHKLGSRPLWAGMVGWDAAALQYLLVRCELPVGAIDGDFGARTRAAVIRYQRQAALAVDGVVGPLTIAALRRKRGCRRVSATIPATIPAGVSVSGIAVGEITARAAKAALRSAYARPLTLRARGRSWLLEPAGFAWPKVGEAVRRALHARPNRALSLPVRVHKGSIRRYVAVVDSRVCRPPVDSRLVGLRSLRPVISRARAGCRVSRSFLRNALAKRLRGLSRAAIRVPIVPMSPHVTRATFGPVIVVRRRTHRLFLYDASRLARVLPVGTGRRASPTPLGRFAIVNKIRSPWWYPPAANWAAGMQPIPPGPGNPLGTRWMGLNVPEIGIHGTPDRSSVGYSRSHGCVRLLPREVEFLFRRVRVGTPVVIVAA
jgi:L,D-transpeptidase catalytic domain/Putative peptidoglycan binding domain